MSKRILKISSAKLTAFSVSLLLAVFCTIGMSFRPAEEGDNVGNPNDTTYVSGPRRSHWAESDGCGGYDYYNRVDYAKTISQTLGNGYTTITANSKGATPVNSTATAAGSQSYVEWNSGLDGSDQKSDDALVAAHTNTITFSATPAEGYRLKGWYDNASGSGEPISTDNPWEKDVVFASETGITSYGSSQKTTYESSPWSKTYYAKFELIPAINVTFIAPSTPSENRGTYTVTSQGTTTTISTTNQTIAVKGTTLTASLTDKYDFVGWYTLSGSSVKTTISTDNPCTTSFTEAISVGVDYKELTKNHLLYTYKAVEEDGNGNRMGSYTVDGVTVSAEDYTYNTGDAYHYSPTLTATPASGYAFAGWYKKEGKKKIFLSYDSPWNPTFTEEGETIYAYFVFNSYTDEQKAQFKVGSTYYTDLNAANSAASSGSNKTIVCTRDGILPPGNYTISAGVKLYIPWSSSETLQTRPTQVTTAETLTAYRTLVFADGANVACYGTIGLGGKIMAGSGGSKSGYVTGPCGVIDMSRGGHIELYSGAIIYAWGFIKGQDMDQGNNTLDVGTITANSGAVIWEDFSIGDWRGGTATSNIKDKQSSWKLFPFQSYSVQNIEIPVTYCNNSTLSIYTSLNATGGPYDADLALIGNSNTLFLMKDKRSVVRKWYDPTSDLSCYELRGTAVMDALDVSISGIISVNSGSFYLPISNNMHIILSDCNMTLSKPMTMQAGAVIEIKDDATLNLEARLHMFDKDEWGLYIHNYYFRSFNNLTNHKNRGAENSNEGLEDAKLIVDGALNVVSGKGYIYATNGGANIMGNGGGTITFGGALPTSTTIHNVTVGTKAQGYIVDAPDAIDAANLCNEDGSYTQSIASRTFHNVYGRWFVATDKDPKDDHTYKFTYITSGAVSGSSGTTDWTPAVYSWDKTGLELRQKWYNVTADACENWWHGQGEQSSWFYNWTLNSDWHQFMPTATEGMYSGSNNKIYTKTDCAWEELGETDVNCLYEIGGVKKALVDGQFIALEPNNNDPAYHAADDAAQYYICFEGCNWHAADKYAEAEKAYIIAPDTFIWYNNAWMSVNFKQPFAYTLDETNVPVYYEYADGEWVESAPYIRVVDGLENRTYWFLQDALTFASGTLRKTPTITILRDISGITTPMTFTGANKTCTLDLNGHVAEFYVVGAGTSEIKMLTLNGASTTFTITDNTTEKKGILKLIASVNTATSTKRWSGIYLQNGSLVLQSGKVYVENPFAWVTNSNTGFISGILVASAKTFTMNGGTLEVVSDYNTYGINAASGTPTVNINHGTIECIATKKDSPYGIIGYGTINIKNDSYIHANAKASSSTIGVYVNTSTSYQGTLNMTGGTIYAEATSAARGVYVNRSLAYDSNEPRSITTFYPGKAYISGGTINAISRTSTDAEGIATYGTVEVSGGTVNATCPAKDTSFGIRLYSGTTTISGTAEINSTATATAYGVRISHETPYKTGGAVYNGVLVMNGGTINASTTSTTGAYGVYVGCGSKAVTTTNASNTSYFAGNYANAGTATIHGGTFNVSAKTTSAYGIVVKAPVTQSGAEGYDPATATPKCTVNGGYFKMSGTGTLLPVNTEASAENCQFNGGYYSHDGNLATYTPSPKHVLTLAAGDANRPPYYYKVAEAYLVTFKSEDGTANIIDPIYQEVGTKPVCSTEPTKSSTSTNSHTFDGWATEANGAKVYEPDGLPNVTSAGATYYAHFATTTLKYRVHLDATTNGGECATENIYVNPGTAVGTLPTATKYGYTFNGWFTAASGGTQLTASTVINADADYYAQFTANSHTLTWDLVGGKVSTAGKIGSTTWPAKNADGTPSTSVAYGTALTTYPVVTKTGYTFNRWDPVPGSSMPDNDVTYTALWNPNTNTAYTVKHYQQNVDGTYPDTPTETQSLTGTTATSVTPAVKSYEGFVSPDAQTVTIAANGSTVVNYYYPRLVYTFTLDAYTNGGTSEVPSIDVIHGATIGAVPPDAQKGCNDFTGWYTKPVGGVKITPEFVIEYDMKTLYAQFSNDVRTYPITYLAGENGTGTVAAGTKTCGEDATLSSSTFTRDGYEQTGWSLTDGGAQAYILGGTYTANASLTLYPVWAAVTYNLTYEGLNGATNSNPATYTIETATITLANPGTRAGYAFTGWKCGGSSIAQIALGSTGDKTITANWSAVTYNLTYEGLNGATNSNPATYTIETATITLANPGTRAGYAFTGWTCGGSPLTQIALGSTGDKVITANWEKIGVTILWKSEDGETTLETDEGVEIDATPSFNGETPTKPTTAEYTYTFDGWTTEANGGGTYYATDAMPPVSAAVTYYAHFAATANVASVTVGGATTYYTTLPLAFAYAANKTTPTIKVLADIALTAKVTYTNTTKTTVTIDLNGHTISGALNPLLTLTSASSTGGLIVIKSSVEGGQIRNVVNSNAARACVVLSKGKLRFESGKIYMENKSTSSSVQAYGIQVGSSRTFTMIGGTVEVKSTKHAYAIYSAGTTNIEGGELIATETRNGYAAGVHVINGTATISGNPTITVSGIKYVNGVRVGGLTPAINSGKTAVTMYNGVANIEGGNYTVTASTNTAYGVYCYGNTFKVDYATNATLAGNYANGGTANVSGGEFSVTSYGATAYGVCMQTPATIQTALDADGNATYDAATTHPKANITGGKFNVSGTSSVGAVNTAAANTDLIVEGGWYNINTNLSGYVAPTKSCNYHVLDLPSSELPYKYEVAEAYKVTWDATTNGGSCGTEYTVVKNGAAIGTLPEATKTNYSFDGWYTAAAGGTTVTTTTTISATQTYYAQFTPDSYTVTLNTNGGTINAGEVTSYTYGTGATLPTDVTKDGHTFGGWFDNSGLTGDAVTTISTTATGNKEFWAKWTTAETGDYLDIVDWTASTLTINANGWSAGGWPYTVNDVVYGKDKDAGQAKFRDADRTLTIPYSGVAGSELDITVKSGETVISKHTYTIPHVNTAAADAFVYVSSGTLEINAASISHLTTLSIRPGASVNITNGTLAIDSLVLRTEPWQTASISGNFTATKTYYTRIAPNNRTISGPGGDITYVSANYYQFALPLTCTVAVKDIKVSHGAKTTYGKAWLLKSYDEASRAKNGAGDNWVSLAENEYIQGRVGYEMSSNSAYYREYLFPVGAVNSASLGTTTDVSYNLDDAGINHAGWNIVGSPLMSVYDNSAADPETGLKISWLQTDGSYDQGIPDYIYPAIPFTYQASSGQTQISFAETALKASAPRRRIAAAEEPERIQWIHLDVKDANGIGDHTSVLAHPTRYEEAYKTGIDVAKQSLTAARAIIYSSHAYGDMAFAGVSDELFEQGVALTVYSPAAQELTFSLRQNEWLNRLQYVWIIDAETGAMIDLLSSDYTAEVTEGTTYGRFYISGRFRTPQIATDIEPTSDSSLKGRAQKVLIEEKIYIMVGDKLYDATGKLVKGK